MVGISFIFQDLIILVAGRQSGGDWKLLNEATLIKFDYDIHKRTFAPLLAPSGALIAIPTYYWSTTHPHFFRSHRSSTLDFHFLSHYSYIKAIMLYKGNHWTWYAGFMGATLVWLGNTNGDLGTSWALPGDNLGMTWGWLGHYFGKTWQTLIAIPTYYWSPPTPLFQITPVLNTGLSLSEPLQLYKGYNAI